MGERTFYRIKGIPINENFQQYKYKTGLQRVMIFKIQDNLQQQKRSIIISTDDIEEIQHTLVERQMLEKDYQIEYIERVQNLNSEKSYDRHKATLQMLSNSGHKSKWISFSPCLCGGIISQISSHEGSGGGWVETAYNCLHCNKEWYDDGNEGFS